MATDEKQTKPWLTAEEIGLACGCAAVEVEAMARTNHWPRVHGESGAKYGVDLDVVRSVLSGNPRMIHWSVPPS